MFIRGNFEMVNTLISKGGLPTEYKTNNDSDNMESDQKILNIINAIYCGKLYTKSSFRANPINYFLYLGNLDLLKKCIPLFKNEINQEGRMYTPIKYAFENKKYDAIKILLEEGADPKEIFPSLVRRHNLKGIIECIPYTTSINATNELGETYLHTFLLLQ